MMRGLAIAGLALALGLLGLWASGAMTPVADWVAVRQREVQDALAGAVRALRAGAPGAWAGLLSICFAYGVLHAAGPGHGKAAIGGYGIARRVPVGRLAGLALASSLAQSAVAVLLVAAGAGLLGLDRRGMEALAEGTLTPLSHALIAALGLWILWRGARAFAGRAWPGGGHDHDHACGCGHAHGPDLQSGARVASFRDAVLLVGAIALRPCSGALFLLILTFAMGIGAAGIAGTFAMGLGTAAVTVAVAILAVSAREGAVGLMAGRRAGLALAGVQIVLGAGLAVVAGVLALRGI